MWPWNAPRQLRSSSRQRKPEELSALPFGLTSDATPSTSANKQDSESATPRKIFPGLPIEILIDIVSHYKSLPTDYESRYYLSVDYTERSQVLSALSQTCRALRVNALPLLWRSLEVIEDRYRTHSDRALATELVRQCEIVTVRQPDLAQYVQTVKLSLPKFSLSTVYKELARCLALLPNLHTVQIFKLNSNRQEGLIRAFQNCRCLAVRKAVIPREAYGILVAFPNVHDVEFTRGFKVVSVVPMVQILRFIGDKCALLRSIRDFGTEADLRPPEPSQISGMHFPHLQLIALDLSLVMTDVYIPVASSIARMSAVLRELKPVWPRLQKIEVIVDFAYASYAWDWKQHRDAVLSRNREELMGVARSIMSDDSELVKYLTFRPKASFFFSGRWVQAEHYWLEADGKWARIDCRQAWVDEKQDCCLI